MDEITIQQRFIEKFNQLEKYLRYESRFDFDESRYKNNIENSKNRLIRTPKYKDILIIAGKIRNLITHNNNVVFPSKSFLDDFAILVDKIICPKLISEVMIPKNQCLIAELNQTLFEVSTEMKNRRITTVPITDNNKVIGVFSEISLFQSLINENGEIVHSLKESKFMDFIDAFKLESNTYFSYRFVRRDTNVYECLDYFENGFINNKRLELVFITENGNPMEYFLGIVSIFDLLEYLE